MQKPRKIVAATGSKQVGAIVCGERGHVHISQGTLQGSLNIKSCSNWVHWESSSQWLDDHRKFSCLDETLLSHARPTHEDQVLLLLDYHQSHITLKVTDLPKSVTLSYFHFHLTALISCSRLIWLLMDLSSVITTTLATAERKKIEEQQ